MSNPSLFISEIIIILLLPVFLFLLIKKYNTVRNFENREIYFSVFLGLISITIGDIAFLVKNLLAAWNDINLIIFLVKTDLIFYFITLIFFFNFFILKAYKNDLKLSIIARIGVLSVFIFAIISIILIPIDPASLNIDFTDPLVIVFLFIGFMVTFFLSIAFTYGLIRKLTTQLEATKELDISNILLIIGFWISIFGSVIVYIVVSHEMSSIIYSIGYYIFIIGYWEHEPFKDIIEQMLVKKTEPVGIFDGKEFKEKFGFSLPESANLLLLHLDNIEKQNFIANLIDFLNNFNIPSILLLPKGGSSKFINLFSENNENSNVNVFEYCVDSNFANESSEKCIMVSIDLSILFEAIKTSAISLHAKKCYLIVDSLTDLITWHGYKKVYTFLKKTTDTLKDHNCLAIFTINPEAHEQSQVKSLELIMDGILEIKEKKYNLTEY